MDDLLPRLRVDAKDRPIGEPAGLFDPVMRNVWLEIGFGGGEHLIAQAMAHPDIGFIGCEPFVNGIAKLLVAIEEHQIGNIRIHDDDAHFLLPRLDAASIGRMFVLFPDPWPKKRHHKRRFITPESLDEIARVLADGAILRIASDIDDYVYWILRHLDRHPDFVWQASSCADWSRRAADWPATRYESRAIEAGRRPRYLGFRRRAR